MVFGVILTIFNNVPDSYSPRVRRHTYNIKIFRTFSIGCRTVKSASTRCSPNAISASLAISSDDYTDTVPAFTVVEFVNFLQFFLYMAKFVKFRFGTILLHSTRYMCDHFLSFCQPFGYIEKWFTNQIFLEVCLCLWKRRNNIRAYNVNKIPSTLPQRNPSGRAHKRERNREPRSIVK